MDWSYRPHAAVVEILLLGGEGLQVVLTENVE